MAIQRGKDILLKIKNKETSSFETIGGLRSSEIAFNAQPIDVTNAGSAGRWREFLGNSGIRSARIRGEGVFRDESSDELIREIFFNGGQEEWQLVLPNFGTLSGNFSLTILNYAGAHDGEVNWDIELLSAGEIRFVTL